MTRWIDVTPAGRAGTGTGTYRKYDTGTTRYSVRYGTYSMRYRCSIPCTGSSSTVRTYGPRAVESTKKHWYFVLYYTQHTYGCVRVLACLLLRAFGSTQRDISYIAAWGWSGGTWGIKLQVHTRISAAFES